MAQTRTTFIHQSVIHSDIISANQNVINSSFHHLQSSLIKSEPFSPEIIQFNNLNAFINEFYLPIIMTAECEKKKLS